MRGVIEAGFCRQGLRIAGVDEVGRGCLAGPVYAACALVDYRRLLALAPKQRDLIRDSKTLSSLQRAKLIPVLQAICCESYVASASVIEIEQHGIVGATFLAMRRALRQVVQTVDVLLIDGKLPLRGYKGKQQAVIKGDNLCYAIAAASILAKEARDDYMRKKAKTYPAYGFDKHVGYGTREHLAMIAEHGITPLHRRNFAPVQAYEHSQESELESAATLSDSAQPF